MGKKDSVIDEMVKFSEYEEKAVDKLKVLRRRFKVWLLYNKTATVILFFFILFIVALFLLNTIKVPYVVYEPVEEVVKDVDIEFYSEEQPYETITPVVETINHTETAIVRNGTSQVGYEYCYDVDMKYNYSLYGNLSLMENNMDKMHDTGYWEGVYSQEIIICNEENETITVIYDMCKYQASDELECTGHHIENIAGYYCRKAYHTWETLFAPDKYFVVKPVDVSTKEICEKRYREVVVGKRQVVNVTHTENITKYERGVDYRNVTKNKTVLIEKKDVSSREVVKRRGLVTDLLMRLFKID
ncbi:hypothetical protein KY336_00745 [Candidatus Woesearchaeota archaeon]|nr:hypothetical protein [Candidatus Woesearchaeota archaeon]